MLKGRLLGADPTNVLLKSIIKKKKSSRAQDLRLGKMFTFQQKFKRQQPST